MYSERLFHFPCTDCAKNANDLILPQASVSHVKSSIVLTTPKDSHRLPLRAAKSAS
jgi:hypothetical protein